MGVAATSGAPIPYQQIKNGQFVIEKMQYSTEMRVSFKGKQSIKTSGWVKPVKVPKRCRISQKARSKLFFISLVKTIRMVIIF
jgi:hypothetical protein